MESQVISSQRSEKGDNPESGSSYPDTSLRPVVRIAVEKDLVEWKLGRREKLVLVALVIVSFVAALDATILVPVLPVRY